MSVANLRESLRERFSDEKLKNSKSHSVSTKEEKITTVQRRDSELDRKASFKDAGGNDMFGVQQDGDDKVDKTIDDREEPKTPPDNLDQKSDEADDKNLIDMDAHDESNGSELISDEVDEEQTLLDLNPAGTCCDKVNHKFKEYIMIEPNNPRLVFFHFLLSGIFYMD